ncbi:MAG: hypothetical protein KatS3mg110_4602 [Pirellulaceae bacterium]|nr:MAG: hypothetical protein KatS3mg110_0011 [Pirellulaceae bacterium]GIW96561.1 MAG: hypothetical protein KatS3mg110_4602 [Pirellulaceae bacterium]
MIIIGEMDLTFTSGSGTFFCPTCRTSRAFVQKKVRRFLTLYFIPVIPLHVVSEQVICQGCRGKFPVEAVNFTEEMYRELARREFAEDVRRVMVLTMLADDQASPQEIGTLRSVYRQLAGRELSDEEIERDIFMARKTKVSAASYARTVANRRSMDEREWLVRAAFLVASAEGALTEERLQQLKLLPVALGIPEDRFRQIIEEASRY